ncbi:uncharacterized protein LOC126845773 isoform X2 [Adelges cooleyi]|uniref:uncharacterized protein LOC126845773 isoform X2 n=1 Tax=Adelges cooleyi TaxID=133065 RepID=UPI0021805865|nr:uncharacterized protein LOC126845773 isoform X2 [Adelges cooleyi]
MILKSFVLLISINISSFVVPDEERLLGCYYYRYMLYAFTMHEINIGDTLKNKEYVSVEQLEMKIEWHEDELRTQGAIVIAMLEELVVRNPSADMYDLMKLNLYLNNVFGSPMIRTTHVDFSLGSEISVRLTSDSNEFIVAVNEVFQKFLEYVFNDLRQHVETKCKKTNPIIGDAFIGCPEIYGDLNDLLPETFDVAKHNIDNEELFLEAMLTFNVNTMTLSEILNATPDKQDCSMFSPRKMLFHEILNRQTYKKGKLLPKTAAELDTSLDPLRNVIVNGRLLDGRKVNITTLYEMIRRSYEPSHINHFQRQVLAATVYPVLHSIGSYLLLIKHMYSTGNEKFGDVNTRAWEYGETIDNIGNSIWNALNDFVALQLLPEKVQEYLVNIAAKLNNLNKFKDKTIVSMENASWIETLYTRCSVPMQNNLLVFDDYDAALVDIRTQDKCDKIVDDLKGQIKELIVYIHALEKYKQDFFNVSKKNPVFLHGRMFDRKLVFDIVFHYKNGSH